MKYQYMEFSKLYVEKFGKSISYKVARIEVKILKILRLLDGLKVPSKYAV